MAKRWLGTKSQKILLAAMHTSTGKSTLVTVDGKTLKVMVKKMPKEILEKIFHKFLLT